MESPEPKAQSPEPSELPPFRAIEARRGWLQIGWEELWRYRELLGFLVWRDIKVRYKQTVLGVLWAVLQPLLTMVVFSILFGRLAGLDRRTGGIPYPIYVYAGLLPWLFFSSSVIASSNSVIGSSNLITKVYFPRLLIPLAAIGVGLADLGVSSVLLLGLMLYYDVALSWQLLLLPLALIATLLAATGVGTLLAALNVSYRDFRYVVPFLMQIWMFLTPVIYPGQLIPAEWRWLLAVNPMGGAIEGFRAALLATPIPWVHFGVSGAISLALCFGSLVYFRSIESRFADII